MYEVAWARNFTFGETSYQSCGSTYMVTIGAVENDVCPRRFSSEQLGAVKVPVDQASFRKLRRDLCALVAVANQCSDLEIWERVRYSVQSVTANVASSSSAIGLLVTGSRERFQ